ncbi:formylglycine-generating enzyme family protein [Candidatus Poribacteria bacterium]|nr:formylglycine-generating enzyme family protein [Candidatus Poribacteria bacterium]
MNNIQYRFEAGGTSREIEMVFVEGTKGKPFWFGDEQHHLAIDIKDFFIAKVPVTQAVWKHVMGSGNNPSHYTGDDRPVETVSWDDITSSDGFLARMNASRVLEETNRMLSSPAARFRLPSETEWEYAARGGVNWPDGFEFSGSNNVDAVAWYEKNSQNQTQAVGQKLPNQLGLHDMSGNVWEWCQDCFVRDIERIPRDGTACLDDSSDRVLRGGCHHNWAVHCTVSKRYEIAHEYRDPCIGFRLVLSLP